MKRVAVVLLLLIANALMGSSKPTLPETAPGKLLGAWLEAFSRADAEALTKFATDHYTPPLFRGISAEEIGESHAELRKTVGAFELYKIDRSTPEELAVVLKSDNGFLTRFMRLSYKVDLANPTKLVARQVAPMPAPPEAAPKRVSIPLLAKELEPKLEALAKKDAFSGAALIAKDGKIVWQKAYGLQDREAKVPVNLETRFRIGSMNKMFTAVAIAQLVEAGKLNFEDTLASVLPDYPNLEVARKITIAQILSHTSGLGDIFTAGFEAKKDSLREQSDFLTLFVDDPLRFEPGSQFGYSNAGFVVLGLVIEKVSGENYYDYVQKHIFDIAGMTSTGSVPKDEKFPNLAIGYLHQPAGKLKPNTHTLPWRGMAAGGGDSTVGDLFRFANALREHKLLSPAMTETVTTGKVQPSPADPESKYAYGFFERIREGERIIGHGGGAPGMNGELMLLMNGYTVVALANLDPRAAEDVAAYILVRLEK